MRRLCAEGDGASAKIDYGVLNLCDSGSGYTEDLKIRWRVDFNITTPICGEYRALAGKRGWVRPT